MAVIEVKRAEVEIITDWTAKVDHDFLMKHMDSIVDLMIAVHRRDAQIGI